MLLPSVTAVTLSQKIEFKEGNSVCKDRKSQTCCLLELLGHILQTLLTVERCSLVLHTWHRSSHSRFSVCLETLLKEENCWILTISFKRSRKNLTLWSAHWVSIKVLTRADCSSPPLAFSKCISSLHQPPVRNFLNAGAWSLQSQHNREETQHVDIYKPTSGSYKHRILN